MSFVIAVIIILFIVFSVKRNKKNKRKAFIQQMKVPAHLGYRKEIPLEATVWKLNQAFDSHFENRVKQRYMDEHQSKLLVDHEYNLLSLELKRFFVMCSLLKNVPMFSEKVDDIWHEMLMFTKEYDQFSKQFYGQFLHHEPVEKKVPQPDSRAFFDLIYTQLFEFTPYTSLAWGGFYRNPLNQQQIGEIQNSSVAELKQRYFRENVNDEVVTALILGLKKTIRDSLAQKSVKVEQKHYRNIQEYSPLLVSGMIFYSVYAPDTYDKFMIPAHATASSNCSSGCGTGMDSGGGDSSGCGSSCGGGCGGGCGGS